MNQHLTRRNPWFVIIPIIAALWALWFGYLYLSRDTAAVGNNLLPGGSFDTLDSTGFPAYWTIEQHGESRYQTKRIPGYEKQKGFSIQLSDYHNGDLSLVSRSIPVTKNTTYFFKGFYHATTDFDLLITFHYQDGTSSTQLARTYPYQKDPWSTLSTSFHTDASVNSVQLIYHLSSNGALELDTTYLAKNVKNSMTPPKPPSPTGNLLADGGINNRGTNLWQPFQTGDNTAFLEQRHTNTGQYLHAHISSYKNGEAKWQYKPLSTKSGKLYQFSTDYRSTAPALVIAETVLDNGQRTFTTLRHLPVSTSWLQYQASFETPKHAQSFFISVVLQQTGSLDTDNYSIYDISKSGPRQFARPLVSITFDDGWTTDYTRGARLLARYGYRGTFYINPSSLDTKDFMTTNQIHQLVAHGNQLASHGYEHKDMTTLSNTSLQRELLASKHYISQQTGQQTVDFASPYGKTDADVTRAIRSLYRSHRGTEDGINTRQNFDPYNLRVLFIGAHTPIQSLKDAIANAVAHNGWLILVYHSVNDTPIFPNTIPPQKLREQLETIQNSGILVDTVQDALHELLPQTT